MAAYAICRFVKYLFVMILSEERLVCGLGATVGAGIGYFTGSVIMGALAGGIFGVFIYEIVSKRILKVAPIQK